MPFRVKNLILNLCVLLTMSDKTNPGRKKSPPKAVALRYDQDRESAPRVIAKGSGLIADKIIALAGEYGIPIHPDADLLEILSRLNINEEIPPETYLLVAEILTFIYRTNQSYSPQGK